MAALTQMYIQGVSTRKVTAISEELCGHSFSASAISEINKKLDAELGRFARRELESEYPYLIIDARYEKLRENGVIRSRAVLVAIGIDWEGRRQVLGVEMANRESSTSWKEFLLGLKRRGLRGVIFTVSDDHPGLKRAIAEVLPEAYWQRCYVHFLRNALDYLPRKVADDCLIELRWLYDRRNAEEARRDLAAWLLRWQEKYPRLCAWVEENIEETLTFYRLPRGHHKHLKSTNMLERLNQEIKRRTHVIRIFPNEESALAAHSGSRGRDPRGLDRSPPLPQHGDAARTAQRTPTLGGGLNVNATASSQSGCSDLASAPELCPCGARAAATSPPAFVNKPHPFSQLLPHLLLLNLTHTTGIRNRRASQDSCKLCLERYFPPIQAKSSRGWSKPLS